MLLHITNTPRSPNCEGVLHLWLVDPLTQTLEVYRLEERRWTVAAVYGGDDVVRAEPFGAIELALARWWVPEAAVEG